MPLTIGRTQYVTATEAAELLGWKRDTFTSLVSRGKAPAPAVDHDGVTKLYKLRDIEKYRDSRPGAGARTDLVKKAKR